MKTRLATSTIAILFVLSITAPGIFAQSVGDPREGSASASASVASATSVPRLVQFNGTLKDAAARPVAGVSSVTFAIYSEQDGGSALWTETQNVLADANGHFTALLGTATTGGFPSELFSAGAGASRWLGVTVARAAEMPRVLIASVPYAMKAGDADTLGGLPASSYVTTSQLAARSAIAAPATTVIAEGGTTAASAGASGAAAASTEGSQILGGNAGPQATITGTGTANFLPLWTSGTNLGDSKLFQSAGGFIGINTTTPLLQLDVNGNSIFRGSFQMAPQATATAAAGQPSHSFQWQGSVFNSSTNAAVNEAFGFRTVPDQNDVANPTAKLDLFYGPGGGTLNDTGLSIDHAGVITFSPNQVFKGSSVAVNSISFSTEMTATNGLFFGGTRYLSTGDDSETIYLGPSAGGSVLNNAGRFNTGIGGLALGGNTTGEYDTAVGLSSLADNTSGLYNTAVGVWSLQTNTTGSYNTAIGMASSDSNTTGQSNTSVGYGANYNNMTGSENVAVGVGSGVLSRAGSQNTFIGTHADATIDKLTNATAIGAGAQVGVSNALVLGSLGTFVGVGSTSPATLFDVEDPGTTAYTQPELALIESGVPNRTSLYVSAAATTGNAAAGFFSSNGPTGYAIEAVNQNPGAYAGYFFGNVHVAGTLSKTAGSFKIDDPIDPAGKYLSHSFVESPDMMNIYNGIVTLDAHGAAVITMPAWFSALNKDFRYQLTALGNAAPKLHVAEEMHGDQFRIAGGKKGMRVSWMVTGIRHDAWADAHRIPTEEDKTGDEQGKYLHPELFGAGPEKAIGPTVTPPAEAKSNAAPPTAEATGRE